MQDGIGHRLRSVALKDTWAEREIRLVARDFSTLPVAARLLVQHLHTPLLTKDSTKEESST
jgi:hypothetical protein